MTPADLQKLHDAAKIIELDGVEGYHTCCERFGKDIADVLIVAHCRRAALLEQRIEWPTEDTTRRANEILKNVSGNQFRVFQC